MTDLAQKSCVPCKGGVDPLTEAEANLLRAHIPEWRLAEGASRIERRFSFGDFAATLDFVNRVGAVAEEQGHHPDICFGWGYAAVTLYTHKIKGLHENDFIMAARIDRLAP